MFKLETITKHLERSRNELQIVESTQDFRIHISPGNSKIGHAWNVSMLPILTCGNCAACRFHCYDVKACFYSPRALHARAVNTILARKHRDEYFGQIDAFLTKSRTRSKFFRWHVAGDILDHDYFACMIELAKKHPDWFFWSYTKMYGIVNSYIRDCGPLPKNLVIMFSVWNGVPMDNPYHLPEFRVRMKGQKKTAFRGLYKCPGNCDTCRATRRGCYAGETTYNDEH